MKKTLGIIIKIVLVGIVVAWISLIFTEYFRYKDNKPMLVVLKQDKKEYDDGSVTIYYGLGYKEIIYERTSLYGKEFGHIFIKVREELPKKE